MEKRVGTAFLAETLFEEKLEQVTVQAREALLALQHPDGYWCFELEADCTIPAEYILMMHYMGEVDEDLQTKIAAYLRSRQASTGCCRSTGRSPREDWLPSAWAPPASGREPKRRASAAR